MKLKRIFSVLFAFAFMFILVGCGDDGDKAVSYDGMNINMASYQSIGAGEISTFKGVSSVSFVENVAHDSSDDADSKKYRLVGVDKNGKYEEIKFKKNNKEYEQKYNLIRFNQTENFIFLGYFNGYKPLYNSGLDDGDKFSSFATYFDKKYTYNYIVDKKTGNIYEIDFTYELIENMYATSIGIISEDLKNKFLIKVSDTKSYGYSYQEVSVEDNKLKFTEVIKNDTLGGNDVYISQIDKFGNKILSHGSNYYVLTSGGEIKQNVPQVTDYNIWGFQKDINGFVYCKFLKYDNNNAQYVYEYYKLLQDASFAKVDSVENIVDFSRNSCVLVEDNVEYYLVGSSIKKVEYTENSCIVTTIGLEGFNYNYKCGQKYIYTFEENGNKMTKYSIKDGVKQSVNIDKLFIRSWDIVNNDEIYFKATNNMLQDVTGYIDASGNVSYSVKDTMFKFYYLMPINN